MRDDGDDECNIDDREKADCAYYGIDKDECEERGCCWQQSNTHNIPWCYEPMAGRVIRSLNRCLL